MGRHTERAAAMRRHPAGRNLVRHTATVLPFPRATISATATADTFTEKETENV